VLGLCGSLGPISGASASDSACAINFETKPLGGCRIVTRNISYDLLEVSSAACRKNYFPSH
jgi:hypothetical protein